MMYDASVNGAHVNGRKHTMIDPCNVVGYGYVPRPYVHRRMWQCNATYVERIFTLMWKAHSK